MNPRHAIPFQIQRTKKWRRYCHWVYRGAHVVGEAGQRELLRARSAADGVFGFEHGDINAMFRENNRGGEAVRSGSDYCRAM
jgi:hypothetical protein